MTIKTLSESAASMLTDPVLSKASQIVFGQCGNCLHRVQCSSRIVNFTVLFRVIAKGAAPRPAGKYAQAIAKVFKNKCGKCDQLVICINIWAKNTNAQDVEEVVAVLKVLSQKDEDVVAQQVEGYLKAVGITGPKLLLRAANLWWKCDKDKTYSTVTLECMKQAGAKVEL